MSILGQFQFRRDTSTAWSSANPILLSGEFGLETDTDMFKIGNGSIPWNSLPYGGLQGVQGEQGIQGIQGIQGEKGDTGATGATGATGPAANAFTNVAVAGQTTVSAEVANDTLTITNGTGIAVTTDAANDSITITNNDRGSQQNIFKNIAVSGQSTIVADTNDDTLTIVGSGSVTVTTDAATDTVTISGAVAAPQNCFAVVTGNTGTASADLPADTLSITGGTGISTTATDTPDGLVITNTDTGSAARTAHEAAADPHPQYTTAAAAAAAAPVQSVNGQTGNVIIEAGGPQMISSVHAATQANNTTTAQDLTGQVFTLPPSKTIRIQGNLIFTAAATTTGAFYGFRVAHGAGANGNVQGSWNAEVALTSAAAATGLADGDAVNVAGGATAASGVLGTATVAGNNSAWIMLTLVNRSTNANATVALQFRSEVANSAVTAQIGTSAVAIIG